MIKRFLLACFIVFTLCGCSSQTGCDNLQSIETCTRILFIGNSYTYVNDLPGTFVKLAQSGGHSVETGMVAEGGWTLTDHVASAATLDALNSAEWDYVVLQEQSLTPAVEQLRTSGMYPSARSLVQSIDQLGATPLFFLTWGYLNGSPDYGMPTYEEMQAQLIQGYLGIADELNTPVAPVGVAWSVARSQSSNLVLWQDDGSHPADQGTYLAACVFYAVIFRQSPEGLTYHGHVSKDIALILQTIATDTVLDDPGQWNLP